MFSEDTEEKILADLAAVVRRAIELGKRQERDAVRDRLMVAINAPPKEETLTRLRPLTSRDFINGRMAPTVVEKRPYGFVKRTVSRAILDAGAAGISKHGIKDYCLKALHADLSEGAIQTALSALSDGEFARYSTARGRWVRTHKLTEQFAQERAENGDAPESGTQGHQTEVNS